MVERYEKIFEQSNFYDQVLALLRFEIDDTLNEFDDNNIKFYTKLPSNLYNIWSRDITGYNKVLSSKLSRMFHGEDIQVTLERDNEVRVLIHK